MGAVDSEEEEVVEEEEDLAVDSEGAMGPGAASEAGEAGRGLRTTTAENAGKKGTTPEIALRKDPSATIAADLDT